MSTHNLRSRGLRRRPLLKRGTLLGALLGALVLAACGPGVGGSGTGGTETALPVFGAGPASVCNAAVAAVLPCAGAAGAATLPVPVVFVDTIDGRRVQATLQDNDIVLDVACSGLRFRGTWGQVPGQAARFYGYTDAQGTAPAELLVDLAGSALALTLRDARGTVLLGPVLVQRGTPPAGAPGCG